MSVEVRKVETKDDFQYFFEFPWALYKDDPNWVPPLLSMRHETLDKQKSAAWEYLEGDYFIALKDGKIAGTIAAFNNKRHNEYHSENIAWFGAFETINDAEVASALLNAATEWARQRGFTALRGPQTFTTHEETGLLIDGFERPILLMPYNPPYYAGMIEAAGFAKVMDSYSFLVTREMVNNSNVTERMNKLAASIMKRGKITLRNVDTRRLKEEFVLFKDIYNVAWEKLWSFVPMTERELDNLVASLGQFFDPKLAFFAYVDGDPAGFIMGVPDFNQVLYKAAARPGIPEPVSLIRALWHWKIRPVISWVRVPLMGVKEQYRNKGIDSVMYHTLLQAIMANPRYEACDGGWILETNKNMVSVALNFGSTIHRTYRYYEKAL